MWMRNRDRLEPAKGIDDVDNGVVDQADAVPQHVAVRGAESKACWPMPKAGEVPMPISSPSRRNVAMCDFRNCARLVHCWPVGSTNCRSSSQIEQRTAGCSAGAYCVPQVVQIQASFTTYLGASPNTPLGGAATQRIMPTRDEGAATRTVPQGTAANSMAQYG
jgi:hypothetical protein